MPTPLQLVIFTDDDGDEFPVAVPAHLDALRAILEAGHIANRAIADGTYRPTGELGYYRTVHPDSHDHQGE